MKSKEIYGIVRAVCVSDRRGVQKKNVDAVNLNTEWGIEGDAHGGNWHRQVSLLSYDKVKQFNEKGADVDHGDFGENIVVEGIDFRSLKPGTRLLCNDTILEMTQIGKECHTHCQIYKKMGDCIMPREGVFARVIKNGVISVGDEMRVELTDNKFQAAIITLSDKASIGEREDKSAPIIAELLENAGYRIVEMLLLPDDRAKLEAALINMSDFRKVDLVITTGGTGFSKRDITPEATLAIAERNAPGISEAIRAYSMTITGRAMLSRGASVIRGETIIVNLPGSPKAASESLSHILPHLGHGIEILCGDASECAADDKRLY